MIRNKSSHLSALGKGLLQLIKAHSQAKAARKFVYNEAINYDAYYLPYVKELVQLLIPLLPSTNDGIELVIDGSQMGKDHAVLMISLVFGKRGVPLGWSVKKGSKGHFTKAHHIELIQQVQKDFAQVFATNKPITLLGDGEFGSIDAQESCLKEHWNYVFRIACNTVLYKEEIPFLPKEIGVASLEDYSSIALAEQDNQVSPFYLTSQWEWELPDDLQLSVAQKAQNHSFVGDVLFSKKRFKDVHFTLWHDPKHKKPIPLISNIADARFVIQAYDKRYSIECLFKDLKSTSFNLHKTRLKNADAISNLIMIAAFAFTLLMELGNLYKKHPVRAYIHQVRPDQIVQSFYTLALGLLSLIHI